MTPSDKRLSFLQTSHENSRDGRVRIRRILTRCSESKGLSVADVLRECIAEFDRFRKRHQLQQSTSSFKTCGIPPAPYENATVQDVLPKHDQR